MCNVDERIKMVPVWLREYIFQLIGETSMCWSPGPTGTFDAAHAAELGNKLVQVVESYLMDELIIRELFGQSYQLIFKEKSHGATSEHKVHLSGSQI